MLEHEQMVGILEGALFATDKPMSVDKLSKLFDESIRPDNNMIRTMLVEIQNAYAQRAIELKEVASGYVFYVRKQFGPWITKLWEEKPQKYTRSLLETLAIIAYRQPVTRADIEDIRGVSVSTNTTKTLLEREWIRVVGHRDVPGKPALFATTKVFLDYFGLKSLDELPPLSELKSLDDIKLPDGTVVAAPVLIDGDEEIATVAAIKSEAGESMAELDAAFEEAAAAANAAKEAAEREMVTESDEFVARDGEIVLGSSAVAVADIEPVVEEDSEIVIQASGQTEETDKEVTNDDSEIIIQSTSQPEEDANDDASEEDSASGTL